MQSSFLDKPYAFIPNTQSSYLATVDGDLFTSFSAFVPVNGEGPTATVVLKTIDGDITVNKTLAAAIAFKNCKVLPRLWYKLNVGFVDGNSKNKHPSNLIILFPEGGVEYPDFRGWCYIPMYTRYLIHRDGRVFDLQEFRILPEHEFQTYASTKSMAGYRYVCVKDDVGKPNSGKIHRLLCLAYKGFKENIDELDTNHIDGIKKNNALSNLEWATRTFNNLHATELGMRPDNHAVVIKSIYTGEERVYFSLWECARALKVHGELIRYRCLTEGQVPFPPGVLFKKQSCERPWLVIDGDPEMLLAERKFRRAYICTDTHTGKATRFESAGDLSIFLNILKARLSDLKYRPEGMYFPPQSLIKEDIKRYHVQVVTFEDECKSLFAEKQKSYLS